MVKQYGFYYNSNLCTGCKGCIAACKDKNDSPVGIKFRKVYDNAAGSWNQDENGAWRPVDVSAYSLSISCNHCDNPACVNACPTRAMHKDTETGIVSVDKNRCIGCGMCTGACPYHEPRIDPVLGVSSKCDFCQDLLAAGEAPACVASCQMRAIEFGDIEELRAKHGDVCDVSPLPKSSITRPNIVINVSRFAGVQHRVTNPPQELM